MFLHGPDPCAGSDVEDGLGVLDRGVEELVVVKEQHHVVVQVERVVVFLIVGLPGRVKLLPVVLRELSCVISLTNTRHL